MPGWLQVVNWETAMVKITWDPSVAVVQEWGGTECMLSFKNTVDTSPTQPVALLDAPPILPPTRPRQARVQPARTSRCNTGGVPRRRISVQLYGNSATDLGTIRDLETSKWASFACISKAELNEAREIYSALFLEDEKFPPAEAQSAWHAGLEQLTGRPSSMAKAEQRPTSLAAEALRTATTLHATSTCTLKLEATPYAEGKGCSNYTVPVMEGLGMRGVDVLARDQPTGEAAIAAIFLGRGKIIRITQGVTATIQPCTAAQAPSSHPAHAPVIVADMPGDTSVALDNIEAFLDKAWMGKNGRQYTTYERLKGTCGDGCTELSIYLGVCGGQKSQRPLSNRIGQYATHPHPQFDFPEQLKVKRELTTLFNVHIALAEEQCKRHNPEHYAKQARLRTILSKHPVFRQNHALEPWFKRQVSADYVGCGMVSKIFTNAYISIGSRTRGCHTDYRNPPITHLSTRLGGTW